MYRYGSPIPPVDARFCAPLCSSNNLIIVLPCQCDYGSYLPPFCRVAFGGRSLGTRLRDFLPAPLLESILTLAYFPAGFDI